jgi:8-oxo-dGTP pyrophosphatase MutT (NUDIX family)
MSKKYTGRLLEKNEKPPLRENISAVFLVAFQDGKVLSIQNERGWDIPGGHLEGEEEPFIALQREVLEEAGAVVNSAKPYAVLSSSTSPKVMLFFASNSIKLFEFIPSEDALSRDLLSKEELLNRYYGDKDLLRSLIENGQKKII